VVSHYFGFMTDSRYLQEVTKAEKTSADVKKDIRVP
jgi:hypothetical protein